MNLTESNLPSLLNRPVSAYHRRIPSFGASDVIWLTLVLIAIGWAFFLSYQRWLDPITDSGRDLYIPEEILKGKKLYRDLLYVFPPLTPYLLSLVIRIFGSSLCVYTALGLTVSAIVLGALYVTARITIHPMAAGIVSLLFATLHFGGGAGLNFIFPYAHAATFGMAFLLLYLVFITVYLFVEPRPSYYSLAFVFALLATWTKIEFAVLAIVTLTAIFTVYKPPSLYLRYSLLLATVSFFGVALFFHDTPLGHHWLWDNIVPLELLASPGAHFFYAQIFGTDKLWPRTGQILFGASLVVAFAGLVAAIDRIVITSSPPVARYRAAILVIVTAALIALCWLLANERFYRAWTALQILLIPAAIRERKHSPFFLLLLFSICTSLRIFLNIGPAWYGFYLTLPIYLLIAYVLFRYLPERGVYSPRAAMLWLPMFGLLMIRGHTELIHYHTSRTHRVDSARGTFYDSSKDRAFIIGNFLQYLEKSNHSELVVMPEGLTLNYLAKTPNPLSFHTFTPPETASSKIEQRILDEMDRLKPELVAITSRGVTEFGYKGFGVDYATSLTAYLKRNYVLLQLSDSPSFKLALLRRARE